MIRLVRVLLLAILLIPLGCGESAPPAARLPVLTHPEGEGLLDALAGGRGITWEPGTGPGGACPGDNSSRQVALDAARSASAELGRVDYSALSLSRFITSTRQMKNDASLWANPTAEIEACGTEAGERRWLAYGLRGQQIPQEDSQPLVTRWAYVYALYDVRSGQVASLIATIRGQVEE